METLLDLITKCDEHTTMELIIKRFERKITKLAFHCGKSLEDKQDLQQELYLKLIVVVRKLHDNPVQMNEGEAINYILKALKNHLYNCLYHMEHQPESLSLEELTEDQGMQVADSEFSLENRILIQQLCDELTPLQKEVIFARYIQGYSAAEVANQKKISRQAVNRIENRVKRKLHTNS